MKHAYGLKLLTVLAIALSGTTSAIACTEFRLKADDNTVMVTRTMEFAADLNSHIRTSPKGRVFQMTAPDGKNGLAWTAKYGYLFTDSFGQDAANDGMNEAGLSVGALYLPANTQYPTLQQGHDAQALPYFHFGDWVLSNFKTVDEIKQALANVTVCPTSIPGMDPSLVFPLHFSIYDKTGKGIVVEFVGGKAVVSDNTVGVLTNSPTYDWQVTNLNNYINLSPYTPKPYTSGGLTFIAAGQGAGMQGLPGDISPPSRFVKMAVMKSTVYPAKNATEALNIAQHMINNVDIPAGYVREKASGSNSFETTEWTVFKDLVHNKYYYHSYKNTTIHVIDLSKLDFSANAKRLSMPISDDQFILDETQHYKDS